MALSQGLPVYHDGLRSLDVDTVTLWFEEYGDRELISFEHNVKCSDKTILYKQRSIVHKQTLLSLVIIV